MQLPLVYHPLRLLHTMFSYLGSYLTLPTGEMLVNSVLLVLQTDEEKHGTITEAIKTLPTPNQLSGTIG